MYADRLGYARNFTIYDDQDSLKLIEAGKLDTTSLITHTYPLCKIDEAYALFEGRRDGVIKVAIRMEGEHV